MLENEKSQTRNREQAIIIFVALQERHTSEGDPATAVVAIEFKNTSGEQITSCKAIKQGTKKQF